MKKTVVTLAINIAAIGSGAPTSPAPSNRYPPRPPSRNQRWERSHCHDPVASAAGQFQPSGSKVRDGIGRAVTGGHDRRLAGGGGAPAAFLPPGSQHDQRAGRPRRNRPLIMTSALFVVGAGYFATAAGLPGVQVPAGSC
jgi:hypothetical protein